MDAEHGRVVIQSLIQGPAIKGRAGTPPKPAGLQNVPTLLPKEAPRTHTKVTIWEAVRSRRSMKAKYLARNGFLLKSSTRTWAVTAFPISTWQGMVGRGAQALVNMHRSSLSPGLSQDFLRKDLQLPLCPHKTGNRGDCLPLSLSKEPGVSTTRCFPKQVTQTKKSQRFHLP